MVYESSSSTMRLIDECASPHGSMSLVGSVAVQALYCCSRKLSAIIGGGAAAAGDVEGTPGRGGG
jgi:hypothetical protein